MTALWPNDNPTRFHDAALRVQPIWIVRHGNHFKYCFSRAEMLLFAQTRWYMLYAYVLRAAPNITPANLTGDMLMDRPEWCIPIYRNSTWDVLSTKPLDGIATPVARAFGAPNGQLAKAGVKALYLPRPTLAGGSDGYRIAQGEPDMFIGYGWLQESTTRHNLRTTVLSGSPWAHTIKHGMASGAQIIEWTVNNGAAVNRQLISNPNEEFGSAMQCALHFTDETTPHSGQQNPTQGGNTYGAAVGQFNGMSPPEAHPLFPFTLESLLGQGSPVVSFQQTDAPDGSTIFDAVTCPLDFQADRYGVEQSIDTPMSRAGETFPDLPIIWPTVLFRTKLVANYLGDKTTHRWQAWIDSSIDLTNRVNPFWPVFNSLSISLRATQTTWFDRAYLYDPALDIELEITSNADLWAKTLGADKLRVIEIAKDGIWRMYPGPVTLISPFPYRSDHTAVIYQSSVDSLAIGFYRYTGDNQDPTKQHVIRQLHDVRSGNPDVDRLTLTGWWRYLRRDTPIFASPRNVPAGLYGPPEYKFTTFIVIDTLAVVKAKIRALYAAGALDLP